MLKGMTGFAQAKGNFRGSQINVEIRSVNHRFFECVVHLPEGLSALEEAVKNQIRVRINRSRLTAVVSVTNIHPKVMVNYELSNGYVRALKQLNHKLKLDNNINLSQIINLEGVISIEKIQATPEVSMLIKGIVTQAAKKLAAIRNKEGRALTRDVQQNINIIKKETQKICALVSAHRKEKSKTLSSDEYGSFLKNTDINEETTRIVYHVDNFISVLAKDNASAKELDFVSQEIQREANTISAKAQNAMVSTAVVKIKSAIDKIREQLQNAE